jgi:hypothetical protein
MKEISTKCVVGYNWEEPWARRKKSTPMRDALGSCIWQSRTMKENVGKCAKLTLTARKPAESIWVWAWPVAHQLVCPVSTGKHSRRDDSFGDFEGATCWCPQRVGWWERHMGRPEELKRVKMFCLATELELPTVKDLGLGQLLPVEVCRRGLENKKRVRKWVLLADKSGIGKPRHTDILLIGVKEDIVPMLVKDVVWAKPWNHAK